MPLCNGTDIGCVRSKDNITERESELTSLWSFTRENLTNRFMRQGRLRPGKRLEGLSGKEEPIRPCVPSHVAYEVGAARQQTVRSPRTMYPHSQEWRRNREEMVYLPA